MECPDGTNPFAPLAEGADLTFYGSATFGGASNVGTVFRITAEGAFITLQSFNGANGDSPYGALLRTVNGEL